MTHKKNRTQPAIDSVSNDDFIKIIFSGINDNERPIIVGFPGNPAEANSSKWVGQPWIDSKILFKRDQNNYISFATFKPDDNDNKKYHRKKKQFSALFAIMLDDIGSKVPFDKIKLAPSWKIETSQNNYQIGFILDQPITDSKKADDILTRIIDCGLTDPGANGPCTRLGRLPVAINGKYCSDDNSFWECKLQEWNPERKYTLQDIVDGLGIESNKQIKHHFPSNQPNKYKLNKCLDDDVHIPRSDENPVISALKASGRYKQPFGEGKHDISCPWLQEHTGQIDHGTAYFEPNENFPYGGFKCMHGHCANRRISALHDFFSINRIVAKHKPIILVQPGEISRICDATEREMAKTLKYYQRGGFIVTITTNPNSKDTSVKNLSTASLTRSVAELIVWQRFDKRSNDWIVCDPPEKYIRVLYNAISYPHLPALNGIARQPYLRKNGSLVTKPGFDHETGIFGVFNEKEFNIPQTPTRQQAEEALSLLLEILCEFPFKKNHDLAAALAAIFTATIRISLPLAPLFHCKAHSMSSGKSYLCELFTCFATPQRGTPHSFPAEDEECRKLLLAELLTAPAVIEFDNLTNDLIPHKSLCILLTNEFISGRILGQSKTVEVGTRALFLSSGNNVDPVLDMTRRAITITLDPTCEIPAEREFHKQPVRDVRANRGQYISLVLTIIRAWVCTGRPKNECKTLATYSDWSDFCRHPLLWLGLPDPATCIFESITEAPDREQLGLILLEWREKFGNEAIMIRDVLKCISTDDQLWELISDIASDKGGEINKNRFGWWLKRQAGRVVNGIRFVKVESNRGSAKWRAQLL